MAMRQIFWGFCINQFGIGPLHYISIHSDLGFKFEEIFFMKNNSPTRRVGESTRLPMLAFLSSLLALLSWLLAFLSSLLAFHSSLLAFLSSLLAFLGEGRIS
jgi:hypothetical protein